jgi:ABC-type glycerol-3-phosphate transport system substrate-binding protein
MKMTRVLSLAAIGAMLVLAAPAQQAQALSLANPAGVSAVQESSKTTTTEVRWHHHWHHHRWHHRH